MAILEFPNTVARAAARAIPGPDGDLPEHSEDLRWGREIFRATRPFAHESVAKSWWCVISTFALMLGALSGAGLSHHWPIRTVSSLFGALLTVRAFIMYHDFMRGAILRESRAASILFHVYGRFALTPAPAIAPCVIL